MIMSSIYQITLANGQTYVGQTHNAVNQRLNCHRSDARRGSKTLLHTTMRELGITHNSIRILESGDYTIEELNNLEKKWIDILKPQLNSTVGGGNGGEIYKPKTKEERRAHLIKILNQ